MKTNGRSLPRIDVTGELELPEPKHAYHTRRNFAASKTSQQPDRFAFRKNCDHFKDRLRPIRLNTFQAETSEALSENAGSGCRKSSTESFTSDHGASKRQPLLAFDTISTKRFLDSSFRELESLHHQSIEQQASSASTADICCHSNRSSVSETSNLGKGAQGRICTTQWLDWDDPFHEFRAKTQWRGRLFLGSSRSARSPQPKSRSIASFDSSFSRLDTRTEHSSSKDHGRLVQRQVQLVHEMRRKGSQFELQERLDWNVATVAEGRVTSYVEVGANAMINRHGKLFEDHCSLKILDPTMRAIVWGSSESPTSKGGLSDLKEFVMESELKTPKYLSTINKGMQLCADLESGDSKKLIRNGTTHATLTKLMAHEYIRAFEMEEQHDDIDSEDEINFYDPLSRDYIDQSLAEKFIGMRRAQQKKDEAEQIRGDLRAGYQSAGDKFTQSKAGKLLTDLAKDVSFEVDLKFMKMKELDLSSVDLTGNCRTYYVRFSVLEAVGLPKMDENKDSYCDTYVRCTLKSSCRGTPADVLSGPKGLCRRETTVVWNSKDPVWRQDFEFAFISENNQVIKLVFELFDINIGQKGHDHLIGYIEFTLFQEGKRCMPLEQDIQDTFQIMRQNFSQMPGFRGSEDEMVRCNNGIVNAEKLGRPSTLKLRVLFSSKAKVQPEWYALLLQKNVRCMLARRQVARTKKLHFAFLDMKESSVIRYGLHAETIWKDYCDICLKESTLPVRNLKNQVSTKNIALQRYPLTLNGCIALSKLLRIVIVRNRLQSLILTDLGLRSHATIALVDALFGADNLETLILDRNPISCEFIESKHGHFEANMTTKANSAVRAVANMIQNSRSLSLFSLEEASLSGPDISIIVSSAAQSWSLKILSLKGNPQDFKSQTIEPAKAVAELLKDSSLIDFDYSCNPMNAEIASLFIRGCSHSILRRLHLHRTGVCKSEQVNRCLASYIKDAHCCLDLIDLSYCGMDESGALIISDAINANQSLQVVILDGNIFGESGYFAFMSHEGKSKIVIEPHQETADRDDNNAVKMLIPVSQLLVEFGNLHCATSEDFDPIKLNRFVDRMQIELAYSEIVQTCQEAKEKRGFLKDFNSFYQWYIEAVTVMVTSSHEESVLLVSLQDCGCTCKQKIFDPLHPYGEYDLNMCLVRSRTILLVLMKMVYAHNGRFLPGMTLCDRDPISRKIIHHPHRIDVHADISTWTMPERGFLHFTFASNDHGADQESIHPQDRFLEENLRRDSSMQERLILIQEHFMTLVSRGGSQQAPYRHAVWLLSLLGKFAGNDENRMKTVESERAAVVVAAFDNMLVSKYKFQLLELLNGQERLAAESQLGIMPFLFTPNNLTGYFRLVLSNVGDREIAIKLLERRSALKHLVEKRTKHVSGRKGGKRPRVELIWRNARITTTSCFNASSTDLTYEMIEKYRIPCSGILQIDFVDICKPLQQRRSKDFYVHALDLESFVELLKELKTSQCREKLLEIRRISAQRYFTCLQVVALIELFDTNLTKERYSRVEVAVCLFSRTIDWRGYRHVLAHVGASLAGDVERRLGRVNLYHDEISSPVGFWQLDLEFDEDLWIMQELIHLAYFEPGNNMIDCTMDDCPFNIPRDWLVEVPHKHKITLFYCRTQVVAQQYRIEGSWDGTLLDNITSLDESFPPCYEAPIIDESDAPKSLFKTRRGSLDGTTSNIWTWMDVEKIRVVADVLRRHSKRAVDMFDLIDADGGGAISPTEFSQGVFRIGIWLQPNQMKLLFFVIDFNGDGDISRHEFCQFWQYSPPLRMGDNDQMEYWRIRGLSKALYEELVAYYDVRTWYPLETVRAYGMAEPRYTLIPEPSLIVKTQYDPITQRLIVVIDDSKGAITSSIHHSTHRHSNFLDTIKPQSPRRRHSISTNSSPSPTRRQSVSDTFASAMKIL